VRRRFALLVNPLAAGGRPLRLLPDVQDVLESAGAQYRVVEALNLEQALSEARAAAEAEETVMTLGGDGLVGPVAGVLRGARSALAIIPAGRGNDFARVLGIPQEPAAAARVAVEGRERLVDVAAVNGAAYVGIASFGIDSDAQQIANESRLVRGNLVYAYATVRALVAWKHAGFTVTVDGERHTATGYAVAVGNSGTFGGGMRLLPDAQVDDGKLDVLLISRHSKLRYAWGCVQVFKGAHLGTPHTHLFRGSVVEVQADRPFPIYADGDYIADPPATMTVEPRSLRVLVPAG
jgi:YegS/Rv2252/BmrU family lipid kinase